MDVFRIKDDLGPLSQFIGSSTAKHMQEIE